jgi:transmembrane sensor
MQSSIQIEGTAADWIARRAGESWSEADQAELNAWLEASTAHRVAFVRLDAAWREAARLKALRAGSGALPAPGEWGKTFLFKTDGADSSPEAVASRVRQLWPRQWAVAASLLVTISLAMGWFMLVPRGETHSTVVGGLQTVPLSDGSQVTLNTDTDIRVAMTDTERRVELEQGEAFFEVARDPTRPFVVKAGDRRVMVVGTKFSVLRDGDNFRVVVTEGQVRVERERGASARQLVTELAPGHIARAKQGDMLVQEKPIAQAEELLSWRSGLVVFRDTTLSEAAAEFNRYNTRKIVIDDPSIGRIRIGGNFRSTNVDAFLRLLEDGFPLVVERHRDRVIVTAAKTS